MSEIKDPKIKLFGKTIELPDTSPAAEGGGASSALPCETTAVDDCSNQDPPCSSDSVIEDSNFSIRDAGEPEGVKSLPCPKQDNPIEEERTQTLTSKDSNVIPPTTEDSKAASADTESVSAKTLKTEEDQSDSQDKTLKKPDKILPCPRCNSMDTKFCYFNNYNVNQPRHFCKNCQRYWTAGGTMRNVPVGAGRRKNKHSISHFRHLTVSETSPNGIHHTTLNPNGTILAFNSDGPLCESMASVLSIADKTIRNGSHKPEEVRISVTHENRDDHPTISSKDEVGKNGLPEMIQNIHPFPPQVPCFPGAPWPYPFPQPTFGPATFPVQFYPTPPPYWGCAVPGSWNLPWIIPPAITASQSIAPSSGPNSPLGKHSRDDNGCELDNTKEEEGLKENSPEKCLWVPKTLRIDDPGEAAKSSIWATLGIKHDDRGESIGGGGLFKAFQREKPKGDEKSHVPETSTVLQANPAALSRSVSFHERS